MTLETLRRAVDVVLPHYVAEREGVFGVVVPSAVICRWVAEAHPDPDIANGLTGLADALGVQPGGAVPDPRPRLAAHWAFWNEVLSQVTRPASSVSANGGNFAAFMATLANEECDPGILYSQVELMLPGGSYKHGQPTAIAIPVREAFLAMARTSVGGYQPEMLHQLVDRYYPVELDDLDLVDDLGCMFGLYDLDPVLHRTFDLGDCSVPAGSVHLDHEDPSKCCFSADPLRFGYKVHIQAEPDDGLGDIPDVVLIAKTHAHFASAAFSD